MIGRAKPRLKKMLWHSAIAIIAVVISAGVSFGVLSQRRSLDKLADPKVPYPHRPFSFTSKNISNKTVWLYSVNVLGHTVGSGRLGTCGVGDSRKDCTPEALMATQAKFLWWEMEDPKDSNAARRGPEDPSKRLQYSLPFPKFDVEADAWRCFYTLQESGTWVGMFEGVVAKPIGAKPAPVDSTLPGANQQWLYFQFKNQSDHVVAFSSLKNQLVHAESGAVIKFPAIPNDKQFHCVAVHSDEGSIYRPQPETKLEIVWYYREGSGPHSQTIDLPEFTTKTSNWYCYFTLNTNNTWAVEFEGVEK